MVLLRLVLGNVNSTNKAFPPCFYHQCRQYLVDDCACVVKNICLSSMITFLGFTKPQVVESVSLYPFDLRLTSMCKVSGLSNELFVKPVSAIKCTCVLLPYETDCNSFVVVPLLH